MPVKLGRVAHWRVGVVGEPLRGRRMKDKDKSRERVERIRRSASGVGQPETNCGRISQSWIWSRLLDKHVWIGTAVLLVLLCYIHFSIGLLPTLTPVHCTVSLYFEICSLCDFTKPFQTPPPVAPLQPGYHYALQLCGMFNQTLIQAENSSRTLSSFSK